MNGRERERLTRWGRIIFVVALCVAFAASAAAQDTPNAGAGEAQPTAEAGTTSAPTASEVLAAEFGIDVATLDSAALDALSTEAATTLGALETERAARRQDLEVRREVAAELLAQAESLPPATFESLAGPLVQREVGLSVSSARVAVLDARVARQQRLAQLLAQHRQDTASAEALELARRTEAERASDAAEEDALAAVELARQRELEARDDTLRELLARQRELAEDVLALTREHADRLRKLEAETDAEVKVFADAKAQLLARVDEVPEEPNAEERLEKVDPVFRELVQLRRVARTKLTDSRRLLRDAKAAVASAAAEVAAAETEREEEEERRAQLEESVGNQRVAVADVQLQLAEQRLDAAAQIRDAMARRVKEFKLRVKFFNELIPKLLPRISSQQRGRYFSITDEARWADAASAINEGAWRIAEAGTQRVQEVEDMSLRIMTWFGVFFVRLIIVLVVYSVVLRILPGQVNRLSEAMFRRRFFRARPRLTVKLAELVSSLARPILAYLAIKWVIDYASATFPEARFLMWIVNAVFTYRIIVEFVSVLALPRWYRREQGKSSAMSLTELDENEASMMADVLGMEINQARKLVRSVKVVVAFWLLATYVPDLVLEATGYTVVWWLVSRIAWFGLFGVVYWVLSTWKDDIARIFERLASTRLPKAVAFVNQHKDRKYGVVVIALASVYVVGAESLAFLRRHALGTDAFKRASTFAFRKKIELQARERDASTEPDAALSELPADFLPPFVIEPLRPDSPHFVERTTWQTEILTLYEAWATERVQGSIALVGEAGGGKTTLMLQLAEALRARAAEPICWRDVRQKHTTRRTALAFVAEVFELGVVPQTKLELLQHLERAEPRVVMLDDCHHFFVRQIGGFEGLETLLDIVNLTDSRHFWVLSFNVYAWSYVNRVSPREHYFGRVLDLGRWTDEEIQTLIERRTLQTQYIASFSDLVISHDAEGEGTNYFEVVKTARGYFRYLHEYSGGNPTLAIVFWLRSLRVDGPNTLQVSLFRRPTQSHLDGISDNHWFVLAALAQHGELTAPEAAAIINADEGFCYLALNFFRDREIVAIDGQTRRARLTPLYFRFVLRWLSNSNFLYR